MKLQNLLQSKNIHFDVISITETQILKNVCVTQNIEKHCNYSYLVHTFTESFAGGALLYVASCVSCETFSDLNIYKKNFFLLK